MSTILQNKKTLKDLFGEPDPRSSDILHMSLDEWSRRRDVILAINQKKNQLSLHKDEIRVHSSVNAIIGLESWIWPVALNCQRDSVGMDAVQLIVRIYRGITDEGVCKVFCVFNWCNRSRQCFDFDFVFLAVSRNELLSNIEARRLKRSE